MQNCRYHNIQLLLKLHMKLVRDHSAEDCRIQRVLIYIILITSQVLYKADLVIQAAITANDLVGKLIHPLCLSLLCHSIQDLPDRKNGHCLKTLKLDIICRHRRYRFCRLQNIHPDQSKILNTDNTLSGQLGIALIQHNTISIVNGLCQTHSQF